MSSPSERTFSSPIPWFGDVDGVAYRYYDLRMTVVPLIPDFTESQNMWRETIYWWLDHTIKMRFVESGDSYWFIMGAQSQKPSTNISFYKVMSMSENYTRFKNGHDGEAYLRLGTYAKQALADVKNDSLCNCGHEARDHDENDGDACLYKVCDCKTFASFQVTMSRRKKTVSDIAFIPESDEAAIQNDPLVWNCLYTNKYSKD